MSNASPGGDPAQGAGVEEALGRARTHAQNAAVHALHALQALVEAGARVPGGLTHERSHEINQSLDALKRWCDPEQASGDFSLLEGVERFLDREIERFEARSRTQPELRTILRALLAVREVVFELSTAGSGTHTAEAAPAAGPAEQAVPEPAAYGAAPGAGGLGGAERGGPGGAERGGPGPAHPPGAAARPDEDG